MRLTLRDLALLALPTLSTAVSISDMTPRATGLDDGCEAVYTSQIYGCSPTDFQTNQCTPSCISALFGISRAIAHECQGVTGQNLVTAFLAGVGPQQLCHNINGDPQETATMPFSRPPHGPPMSPTIGSSTTTAREATTSESLLVDTSSTQTATIIPTKKPESSSSSELPSSTTSSKKTTEAAQNTRAPVASSQTSSAAGNSQTNLNDHSGGGSPFDTEGNMDSAAAHAITGLWTILLAAGAMLIALQ